MSRVAPEEFVEFAQATMGELRRTGYLMCGDWHRAEDAAQEALIRRYRNWHRIERREGVRAWAKKTTLRILIDESRRPWRREQPTAELFPTGQSAVPADHSVENREALMTALLSLPPRRRACVVLRYYEDLSVAQTAEVLGCAEGTVKRQTHEALQALRPLVSGDFLTRSSR